MNWVNQPAAESRVGQLQGSDQESNHPPSPRGFCTTGADGLRQSHERAASCEQHVIHIGKVSLAAEGNGNPAEVFTMTLGGETIELLPFKNWGQLDVHKWRVQGKLPGTPAGLEVTIDHVKIAGETVSMGDPEGPPKLEKAFNEWLAVENRNLELARQKFQARPSPASTSSTRQTLPQPLHFKVEVSKGGQVHIGCLQGAETVATVGLTAQGFNSLFSQGLMRKPRVLDVGALHDWVELDGELCSFEHGINDAGKLENLLNERYLPVTATGPGKDVLIFANAASPTGFDIQFPIILGGVPENRRRSMNDAALELLQEPVRCGLLQPGIIVKLTPPALIFKRKTPDGGETYLEKGVENTVTVTGDDARERLIELSRPVNYMRLSAVELTAVFNHPAINRHSKPASSSVKRTEEKTELVGAPVLPRETLPSANRTVPQAKAEPSPRVLDSPLPDSGETVQLIATQKAPVGSLGFSRPVAAQLSGPIAPPNSEVGGNQETLQEHSEPQPVPKLAQETAPPPNLWLKEILAQPPIRHDWFACLVYAKLAEHFSNSREGSFGPSQCWAVALGEVEDVADSAFKGVFLTQKGGLGFLCQGRMARFHRGVVFLGTPDSVLEGIDINLVAVGLEDQDRIAFIVTEGYLKKFGVSNQTIAEELTRLRETGASLMSVSEALESRRPLELVWTVPAEQLDPGDPQALESIRPQARLGDVPPGG